ncbi:hypothetical protein AF335_06160 [Streptomyces eurocidicus]|uniref:Uncharacterized protein n=1 Tax=Streptomyces eurocidicus TaxID=66423 RepID=A0A2N8NZN4_STREU|nr:hypothetical protein [Streptomyces eurocidicus]MBB5118710.1 hypothetical protein [Streptomyces eurocidicus]MBF6051475.1 hypothetical protein [Streptomyces eurocidicus]PNE34226.1 hypothetical protein AF335_06160 [Streptomyces eurocidicus]
MNPDDPRMDNVECDLAQTSYAHGQNGLQIAEQIITTRIWALLHVRAGRAQDPDAFPAYGPDASEACAARRIVACLIDAGWRPPDTECLNLPTGD